MWRERGDDVSSSGARTTLETKVKLSTLVASAAAVALLAGSATAQVKPRPDDGSQESTKAAPRTKRHKSGPTGVANGAKTQPTRAASAANRREMPPGPVNPVVPGAPNPRPPEPTNAMPPGPVNP